MRSSKSVHSVKGSAARRWRAAAATAAATAGLVLVAPASAMAATTVTPTVQCYWSNPDGSTTFSVGYINSTSSTLTYAVGPLNFVNPAPQDRGQPTVFLPGTHTNVWAPTVTATDLSNNPNWTVNGVAVNYSGTIPACVSKPVSISGSTTGYLGATAGVVGVGLYILKSPRRRRALTRRGAKETVTA